ncbi:uncharacterized protein MONOS_8139 [Monocercomonoides exilis]|uniref:uncharacterized protein n=1 Tax=Monocercomonoides exilis TaxID=2049356 RepID=UPI00355AC2E1|nr:hypothetical protein MONOS_8139 [Monocercomonoides exilis]|eukprot:MONOS_8139.1-p1 / transcript=MONOS_8139.1 / gene=MONOS_8139 / organism=Monocercomonoides_exilis_PA203 / gene_product=unspecified product / transcript_product=unspecified product / location=Mono_scaffold00298:23962-24451(+) / protein_length=84 / sequence_SO=supercontig / SO=protein_coding / is_pseudo=false
MGRMRVKEKRILSLLAEEIKDVRQMCEQRWKRRGDETDGICRQKGTIFCEEEEEERRKSVKIICIKVIGLFCKNDEWQWMNKE